MNRFLTRKRAKKGGVEPKFELDLSTALPSTDEFRTSLIMPNLSARFSMLREQDDPNSKLGKASDDSVLSPRRQSRLPEFGYHRGLADIAEVASISSFTRPPFAQSERGNSVVSDAGYGTDDDTNLTGSIMNRKKPGEGNVLFGGRQKVYVINAAGSESSLGKGGMRGRALYDDDVSLSAFQKHRLEEKERLQKEQEEQSSKNDEFESPSKVALYSPSLKRETSSSTATSSPSNGRTSTAATSIASQGAGYASSTGPASASSQSSSPSFAPQPERPTMRGRRLYEQGLDRDIKEQHSASMTRLNSAQRTFAPTTGRTTPDPFPRAPSRTQDRFKGPKHPFRAQSPTHASPFGPMQGAGNTYNKTYPIQDLSPSPPSSPPPSSSDDVLQSALNPSDRGKATAMGAFNKPKQFSEKQYLERQMTLNKGRETPTPGDEPLRKEFSPNKAVKHPGPEPPVATRPRAISTKEENPTNAAFSVFQKAASQLKGPTIGATSAEDRTRALSISPNGSDIENIPEAESEPQPPIRQFARNGRFGSPRIPVVSPDTAPPAHEHPAFRAQRMETEKPTESPLAAARKLAKSAYDEKERRSTGAAEHDGDSPTLGPTSGGLNGLVRQHLRNASSISNSSQTSIYPAVPPAAPISRPVGHLALRTRDVSNAPTQNSESETPAHSSYSHSNPWDLEDFDGAYMGEADSVGSMSPIEGGRRKIGEPRPSIETTATVTGDSRRQGLSPSIPEDVTEAPWQQELRKTHFRNASTETTQERIAFANDLAARQKAIQEKLKERMESEQRSTSPTPGKSAPFRAIEMLRTKSSRDSMRSRAETPSKPMKILGLGSTTNLNGNNQTMPTTTERGYSSDLVRSDESRSNSRPVKPWPIPERVSPPQSAASQMGLNGYRGPGMAREGDDRSRDRKDSNPPKRSPPESIRSSVRSRSNSELSNGRSRSRNGRYKDDLDKAMELGTSTRTTMYPEPSPAIPEHYQHQPNPSVDVLSNYVAQQVNRTNEFGRVNGLGIQSNKADSFASFEQKGLFPPPQPVHAPNGIPSPRASPSFNQPGSGLQVGLPANPRSSPSPLSPGAMPGSTRPSPMATPFSANSTPPISAASTPVGQSFAPGIAAPVGSGLRAANRAGPRKRIFQKSDISEPTLISTTSVIDTVDLPEGASLRNGMDEVSPQASSINPLRRRFGFGRVSTDIEPPKPPFAAADHSHSADESEKPFKPRHKLRKSSSEGAKIGMRLRAQQEAKAMQSTPSLAAQNRYSPIHVEEGAMF